MCRRDGECRLLRLPDVLRLVGVSKSSLYNMIARRDFPAPVRIGRRAVGWLACEVHAWIETRARARPPERPTSRPGPSSTV